MKQNVNPILAVVAAIVVFAIVGYFMWQRSNSTGLTKEQEQKFLKPLQLGGSGQQPSVIPPPPPSSNTGPVLLPPGGGAMPGAPGR